MNAGYIGKSRGITLSIFTLVVLVLLAVVNIEDVDAAVIRTGVINVKKSSVNLSKFAPQVDEMDFLLYNNERVRRRMDCAPAQAFAKHT